MADVKSNDSKEPLLPLSSYAVQETNYVYITSVIAAYWVVSISMVSIWGITWWHCTLSSIFFQVYLNKMLLSNEEASIPAPLFVTWYQCFFTFIVCIILGNIYNSSEFPLIKPSLHQAGNVSLNILYFFNIFVIRYTAYSWSTPSLSCLRWNDYFQQYLSTIRRSVVL